MEYMEQQAQMTLDGGLYNQGYKDGLLRAAEILRKGVTQYERDAIESTSVLNGQAATLAATLLRSWANGLEIEANRNG